MANLSLGHLQMQVFNLISSLNFPNFSDLATFPGLLQIREETWENQDETLGHKICRGFSPEKHHGIFRMT